jgi:hypothetical protein
MAVRLGMNVVSSVISGALISGAITLLLFLFSFESRLAKLLGHLFWRIRGTILLIAVLFLFFSIRELLKVNQTAQTHRNSLQESPLEDDSLQLEEFCKSQRNAFMAITGFVMYLGIILISSQVHSWTDRIDRERLRLRKTE